MLYVDHARDEVNRFLSSRGAILVRNYRDKPTHMIFYGFQDNAGHGATVRALEEIEEEAAAGRTIVAVSFKWVVECVKERGESRNELFVRLDG